MKKTLLKFEENAYSSLVNKHTDTWQTLLNKLVSTYNEMSFGEITTEELGALIENPKRFLFRKIVGDSQVIPMVPEKGFDIIEKPIQATELIGIIEEILHPNSPAYWNGSRPNFELNAWELKDSKVILSEAWKSTTKESYQTFTQNEKQEKALESLLTLEKNLNEFRKFFLLDAGNFKEFFPGSSVDTTSQNFDFKADITQISKIK